MNTETMKNFHVLLPNKIYTQLKTESQHSKQPITKLVRCAVEYWLKQQQIKSTEKSLEKYVQYTAGTKHDLDHDLETAAIEHFTSKEGDL